MIKALQNNPVGHTLVYRVLNTKEIPINKIYRRVFLLKFTRSNNVPKTLIQSNSLFCVKDSMLKIPYKEKKTKKKFETYRKKFFTHPSNVF